jgi:hypothetical protein
MEEFQEPLQDVVKATSFHDVVVIVFCRITIVLPIAFLGASKI